MSFQRGILASLRSALAVLSELAAVHGDKRGHALSALVCEWFGFVDVRDRIQRARCQKALRVLDVEGRIVWPAPQHDLRIAGPRLFETVLTETTDVRDIADLEIAMVETSSGRAIWNTLMDREHPPDNVCRNAVALPYQQHPRLFGGGRFIGCGPVFAVTGNVDGLGLPCTHKNDLTMPAIRAFLRHSSA